MALALIQLCLNGGANLIVYYLAKRLLAFRISMRRVEKQIEVYRMIFKYGFFVLLNTISLQIIFYSSNLIIAIFFPISSVTFFVIAANLIDYMKKTYMGCYSNH